MFEEAVKLDAAFDETQIRWHDRASALATFKECREITFGEDGEAYTHYDSETLKLSDALKRFAYDNRNPALYDLRTLPVSGAGAARPGIDHKGNYQTTADKVAYIQAHGLGAWEALPSTGVASHEVTTFEDWRKLSLAEKSRRIAADPDCQSKLKPAAPATFLGARINEAALEKHKKANPSRFRR